MPTEQDVITALTDVVDPELGSSIVELGMVRSLQVHDGQVEIELVLTTPGCPLADWIVGRAHQAVITMPGVERVDIKVLDEPWQPPDTDDWGDWIQRALRGAF